MSDFTFLTEDQCYSNPIDVIKKRKSFATATDLAIFLGISLSKRYGATL